MSKLIIQNANIVNQGKTFKASIVINSGKIVEISADIKISDYPDYKIFNAEGLYVLPGIIDTHVHFREPGLTTKADIFSESRAAAAGGVTSFFDMPNTIPQTTNIELLKNKFNIAEKKSLINYSFFIGAANDNLYELEKINPQEVAGIKLFYASSTGNMLVDKFETIETIFKNSKVPIVIHSEEQDIISQNYKKINSQNTDLLAEHHEEIRSAEACYVATKKLIELAKKHQTKVHFLHISTSDELELFSDQETKNKLITAEVSPNHLFFDSSDYKTYKMLIKCNPSIKNKTHKLALVNALNSNKIDSIATDHAPHILSEKLKKYDQSPSGIPSIQHSLNTVLDFINDKKISLETIVEKMCHNPATIFNISKRGFIKENYWADIVIVDLNDKTKVEKKDLLYKCKWSPLEGHVFNSKIVATLVNGEFVFKENKIIETKAAMKIDFDRN
ncbi:MAG: dihydroorotase [Bacteroidales bacterium]|nr:dihydroorotase [Bacteroidales bacterium]